MKIKSSNQIILWSSALILLVLFLVFVDKINYERTCSDVQVEILDQEDLGFVTDAQVIAELSNFEGGILGKPMDDINMQLFENKLNTNDHINNAEVYSTIDGVVHVKLQQRRPIIRLICENGAQLYLDNDGMIIPMSEKYSAPVLLANGFIPEPQKEFRSVRDNSEADQVLNNVYQLGAWLSTKDFWLEMIQQVYVDHNGDMILITRVGDHKIILGDSQDLDEKFEKLMAFYKKGLNRTGWNLYSDINLKYHDQVVCRKTHD